ncbi:hypothetical protein CLM62_07965 [Streptomyces sp. SA15]|uniref:TniQ family protein n=1 Tax=Streptomyces sp. SA15 TaxID=934019 RepID=UPI000BB095A5|nr:TniQ family protein [Streptomyces sp. SA15]PAZ16491.1 hypothetical protein CLM62_07965 [Streptomyces sp. SA15]
MSTRLRSFGRSLDPLDGESLAGFVLRLSHRLRVSPIELARLTGMTDRPHVARAALSTFLTPSQASGFATATRLTPDEAVAMTLEPLASRYPPLGRSLDGIRAGRTLTIHTSDWLFATTCRYCPVCLTGDGSPIQNEHGGPWQNLWRLPVVFACTRHDVFLEHLCPSCKEPINASNRSQLIARPAVTGIHPAHCRSTQEQDRGKIRPGAPCGAPLGHDAPGGHRPGPALLTLQHKIVNMFGTNCPEQEAHQYFTELILLAGLVMISWPRIRPAGTTRSLAAAIDRHLAILEETDGRLYHSSKAPVDARACAGMLQVTDRILAAEDLREALVPLAPEENRTLTGVTPSRHVVWDQAFRKHRSACSERFQLAADTVVHSFRRDRRGGGYRLPATGIRYRPEHIPAALPQPLADRHLQAFPDVAPKMLRRSASVFLVRRARGGNINEAAQFLGISTPGKAIGYGNKLNQYLRAHGKLHDFELALDAITDELHEGPLIDYQQRREALSSWTLEPDIWQRMATHLPILPGHRTSISDDRKRLAVSVYIWTRVTEGELEFAPCPHIAHDPELRSTWSRQRHNICHWLKTADDHPYYRALKPLLDAHAQQLAGAIDCTAPDPEGR